MFLRLSSLLIYGTLVFPTVGSAKNVERVGGIYKIVKIEKKNAKNPDRYFVVDFESVNKTGRFDRLRLESDHIHLIEKGQTLRLGAQILKDHGKLVELAQVLLFLPHKQGYSPVWMHSRKAPVVADFKGSKFLEMHAPQADYAIF